jgi:ceramide glucosyltransferase
MPRVTILKPLRGAESSLYECLRPFCPQDHAFFEIVFGTQDPADPALQVARRLRAEFPQLALRAVIDGCWQGDEPQGQQSDRYAPGLRIGAEAAPAR